MHWGPGFSVSPLKAKSTLLHVMLLNVFILFHRTTKNKIWKSATCIWLTRWCLQWPTQCCRLTEASGNKVFTSIVYAECPTYGTRTCGDYDMWTRPSGLMTWSFMSVGQNSEVLHLGPIWIKCYKYSKMHVLLCETCCISLLWHQSRLLATQMYQLFRSDTQ